jgi:type I restriction enzyme S subunit
MKFLLARRTQRGRPDMDLLSVYRDYGVVPKSSRDDNFNKASEDLSNYLVVRKGDVVINKMKAWQGSIAVSEYNGIVSPAYFVFQFRQIVEPKFVHHVLRCDNFRQDFEKLSAGVRPNQWDLDIEAFGRLRIALPAPRAQRGIAVFLDRKTATIDALIAKKERLTELLQEQRQTLITQAVGKGLDPSVPLKESGYPWIGAVPRHWSLLRLKQLSHRISGRLVYQPAQYFVDDGVPFIMGNNVTERGIVLQETKFIPVAVNARFSHYALQEGDVVTVRVGAPGVTAVVPPEADGLNCGSLMIIRRNGAFESRWLAAVMNSPIVRAQIDLVQYGAAQEQINITDAVNFVVPTPPPAEQTKIAEYITQRTRIVDRTLDAVQQQLDRLREYRQALITAAVTGKIDVSKEPV